MKVEDAYGMSLEDVLRSARVAIRTGDNAREFVREPTTDQWRVAGLGLVGGLMKPFTRDEMKSLVEGAETVVVMRDYDSNIAYRVRGQHA